MIQQANPIKDYHACRTHVSRGMLADLAQRPRLFEGRYITGTMPGKEPTPAMKLGTMIHALALEGRRIAIDPPAEHLTPSGNLSEKKATVAWVKEVEAGGYIVSDAATTERCERASESVLKHLRESGIEPKDCIVEKPIFWERADGMACRALPDLYIPRRLCLDLKTTETLCLPDLKRSYRNLFYWLQPPHYCEGIEHEYGVENCPFAFVFVETREPFRVWSVSISPQAQAKNRERREVIIDDLKRRTESGDWSDPEEHELIEFDE